MFVVLSVLAILAVQADAQLERGTKSENLEEIVLVGANDWQSSVAATPLAIWTGEEGRETRPFLILPREVKAGKRMGWVDQVDLERYGPSGVLHIMKSANVSTLVINGEGETTKSLVELAQKESIKAYVTATLNAPEDFKSEISSEDILEASERETALTLAKELFFQEMGLDETLTNLTLENPYPKNPSLKIETSQLFDPETAQLAIGADGRIIVSERLCPTNPDVRDELYDRVEELIEDYEVDGVVLYEFGFLGDEYCFCDVCKDEFYKDTGIDLARVGTSSYNLQRWNRWKEEQTAEIVSEVRNITSDLGPVDLGVVIGDPFDGSEGYNYAEMAALADLIIISPVPSNDLKVAAEITETPVYIRLSDDYVEYTISTQNVEGAVEYIEDLIEEGAAGITFEYDVVYTPLWSELEPPSPAANWLLERLDGNTLAIGDVFWDADTRIRANDSFEMAEMVSQRWERSPGAVLAGDNYSAGLTAATIGCYLNWPVLFVGDKLPNSTESALQRLGATQVVVTGLISEELNASLESLNLTVIKGDREFLLEEMRSRGDEVESVVLTNSHDLSLLPPKLESETERTWIGDDLLLEVKKNPANIPAESEGEIIRLEINLTNLGEEDLEDVELTDIILPARLVVWWTVKAGTLDLTDPTTGKVPTIDDAFFDGTLLSWHIGHLGSHEYATLDLEVEILHPLDAGWTQPLDAGIFVNYSNQEEDEDAKALVEIVDEGPVINITYPARTRPGMVEISWEISPQPYITYLNYYNDKDRWMGYEVVSECAPGRKCNASILLSKLGDWTFNIEIWRSPTELWHTTKDFTIEVNSSAKPINVTAFSHTKIPRLSLVSAQMAGARGGILFDVDVDPQDVDPEKIEEDLEEMAKELKISPKYLTVVGGPGSLPFPSSGLEKQTATFPFTYDIYREYQIKLDDDDYQDVASGRMVGLSVYDVSQMVARTLAYDKIEGDWKNKALLVSSPADYPTWPKSPIPLNIGEYLQSAGMDAENLREETATCQRVSSGMNNGQNVVYFDYHGNVRIWQLSLWNLIDWNLDKTEVKRLTLAPQTTTSNACFTSRLKGPVIPLSDQIDVYIPMNLEDSISLAFLRAGAVNYVGSNAASWIFFGEEHGKKMYQEMIFENATIGEALMEANNLYIARAKNVEGVEFEDVDDFFLVEWEKLSAEIMFNDTINEFMLFGDPAFRPAIPKTPTLPYRVENVGITSSNDSGEEVFSITPTDELGTDWIYWVTTESIDGELMINAPPALVGEAILPEDAEEIVVKENGRVVWHDEYLVGEDKRIIWPVIRPTLNETRTFTVEYRLIPGKVQVVNVTAGWNPFSMHLDPKNPSLNEHIKRRPYRSVFTLAGEEWNYTTADLDLEKDSSTSLKPGKGYIIDSVESFSLEIEGTPVDLPYKVDLLKGWNLVGVPIDETVSIGNITVSANHKRYDYSEAVKEGFVSAFLWRYEDGEWAYVSQNESMVPGVAYMVEAIQDCKLEFR